MQAIYTTKPCRADQVSNAIGTYARCRQRSTAQPLQITIEIPTHATRTPRILNRYGKGQGTYLQKLRQGDQCNGGDDAGAEVHEAQYPFVAAHIAMPPCYWVPPGTTPILHWGIAPQPAASYSHELETLDMCSLQSYMYWRWLSGLMLGM